MSKKNWLLIGIVLLVLVTVLILFQNGDKKEASVQGEQVVVKVWDWGVSQQEFYDEQFEKFMEKNPNIKIEHSVINVGQYDSMLQLSMKSNNGPDIFWKPGAISSQELIEKGWVQPIEEFASEELKALYPAESFVEGVCVFDGKLYSFPMESSRAGRLRPLYWNKKLFAEAGLDSPPETWSQLREYAKKITTSGADKYYGYIMGGKMDFVWAMNVGELAAYAGNHGGEHSKDHRTGLYCYDHPANVEAFRLLLEMKNDGSIFPGVMAIDDEQARAYFATNKAAMIIGGPWNITGWKKYPNLDYGIAAIPVPDSGMKSKLVTGFPGAMWWMRKDVKNPEAVWKVLEFLASLELHKAYSAQSVGFSIIDEARQAIQDPHMQALEKIASERVIIGPNPVLRNSAVALISKYEGKLPAVRLTFQKAIMEAWTQNDANVEQRFAQATRERNELFLKAIELAQKDGIQIKTEDFSFPDFNPLEDYLVD